MTFRVLLILLWAAAPAPAVEPEALAQADALYLNRHQGRNLEQSTQRLREELHAAPRDAGLLWRLGRNLVAEAGLRSGRDAQLAGYAEATAALKQAITAKPAEAQAHYWLAQEQGKENGIRRSLGLAKSMKAELETTIALDPAHAGGRQLLCELLRQLPGLLGGDKKRAVSQCEEALRLTPNEAGRYVALAEAYASVQKRAEAAAVLRKAFEIKRPDDPASYDDDLSRARALLEKLSPRQ